MRNETYPTSNAMVVETHGTWDVAFDINFSWKSANDDLDVNAEFMNCWKTSKFQKNKFH